MRIRRPLLLSVLFALGGVIAPSDAHAAPSAPRKLHEGGSSPTLNGSGGAVAGGKYFFPRSTVSDGNHLWVTDGTAAGTKLAGKASGDPWNAVPFGNRVVFRAQKSGGDPFSELWISDGTPAGTTKVNDLKVGTYTDGVEHNGKFYFGARTQADTARGVYETDGTPGGSKLAFDLEPPIAVTTGRPLEVASQAGKLFVFGEVDTKYSLYASDATKAGTVLLDGDVFERQMVTVGTKAVFAHVAQKTSIEKIAFTDGTPAGTGTSAKSFSHLSVSDPVAAGAFAYFVAAEDGSAEGSALWKTDGTAAGTILVKDLQAGSTERNIGEMAPLGSKLIFSGNDGTTGSEVWISDGTPAGTVLLKDINPGLAGSNPARFVQAGSVVVFAANDAVHGSELWETDGTAAGTHLVADLNPGAPSGSPNNLHVLGNTVVFDVSHPTKPSEDVVYAYDAPAAASGPDAGPGTVDAGPGDDGGVGTGTGDDDDDDDDDDDVGTKKKNGASSDASGESGCACRSTNATSEATTMGGLLTAVALVAARIRRRRQR